MACNWWCADGGAEASAVARRRLRSGSTAALGRRCCRDGTVTRQQGSTAVSAAARKRHRGSVAALRRKYAGCGVTASTTGRRRYSSSADVLGQRTCEDRAAAVGRRRGCATVVQGRQHVSERATTNRGYGRPKGERGSERGVCVHN